jgi:hypothetical protein
MNLKKSIRLSVRDNIQSGGIDNTLKAGEKSGAAIHLKRDLRKGSDARIEM